ncbi:hypothetical protein H0X48_03310 [Candidatus Dependentiae bacterium]|nr:hypothetical protein [Candidatus Dependentiae bacterium]
MVNLIKYSSYFWLVGTAFYALCGPADAFHTSFISSYDLSGRYTHEYHPYVLKKTRDSFLELEHSLRKDNFSVNGRILILGYQEDAVAPYKTDWQRQALEDEAIAKTAGGLAQPTKNIFGYLTGFLLKDAEWLEKNWFKDMQHAIKHVYARPIDLFKDSAVFFQKHALGKDFPAIIEARDTVEHALYSRNLKTVLGELISFWMSMYENASKTGSQETIATQDMLFSIDYARALIEGQAPLKKLFVGPDITYPIEILSCQQKEATAHAQQFIHELQTELVPVNNQKTVYIFCSFVDGVGKSTLLNNIANWGLHGLQFDKYERCDNSSSQEATLFELKENTYIADLPAQISHYTIKPDGLVFTDISTVKEIDKTTQAAVIRYAIDNKALLIAQFEDIKEKAKLHTQALYVSTDHVYNYAVNCQVLGVIDSPWVGFMHENKYYLFHKQHPHKIRALTTLAGAHSFGLKVIEPEQMLFTNGMSIPMHYATFLDALKSKLHAQGIEQVVFVDFLSMYPRSSRENIRVNFVLQYLKKIFGDTYNLGESFYKHRANREQEICQLLLQNFDKALHTIVLETALRWAMYTLMEEKSVSYVTTLKAQDLEDVLGNEVARLLKEQHNELTALARNRLEPERALYYQTYALDITYETVVRFSFEPLQAFSDVVSQLFSKHLQNEYYTNLWAGMEGNLPKQHYNLRKPIELDTQIEASVLYAFDKDNRNQDELQKFVRALKAQWYAMLSNMLSIGLNSDGDYEVKKVETAVPPLLLKSDGTRCSLVQKVLPLLDTREHKIEPPLKFHLIDGPGVKRPWGVLDKQPYCMDWDIPGAFFWIYAYGYTPGNQKSKNIVTQLVDKYRQECVVKYKQSTWGMPTTVLLNQINAGNLWSKIEQESAAIAQAQTKDKNTKNTKNTMRVIAAEDPQIPVLQLWTRMIATLDMILKDMDRRTIVLVRKGSKEDFAAALQLTEKITLPLYFGIKVATPLFEDYATVDPVIPWQIINK